MGESLREIKKLRWLGGEAKFELRFALKDVKEHVVVRESKVIGILQD